MKIYTKTGDRGQSSLFGGKKVLKNDLRLDAYGTVDELNASIGIVLSQNPDQKLSFILERIQNDLFVLGADLATPQNNKSTIDRVPDAFISHLENDIDQLEEPLPPLKSFILPGGTMSSSSLHLARTICRRAERACCSVMQNEDINMNLLIYLNRLSDLLFVMARYQNFSQKVKDTPWNKSNT